MVGKHKIQTFEVAVVVMLFELLPFDVFVPRTFSGDKRIVQIYLNVSSCIRNLPNNVDY